MRALKERVIKIFNHLDEKPGAIFIKNSVEPFIDENFFYATNLEKGLFEGSAAIIFPDGNIDLIVSELESESAKKANAELKVYKNKEEFDNFLKESLSSIDKIGINANSIVYKDFVKLRDILPGKKLLDVSIGFSKARSIKDFDEIQRIRKATNIVDKVMEKIPAILKEDMFEYELAAEIGYLLQKYGADKSAFDIISSFGKNAAEPHYTHGETKLKNGDFVLCDFGACFKRYNSDITRTFVFGKASENQKKMYEVVKNAQQVGFNAIKNDIEASFVHKEVESFINDTEYNGRFIHSTGHSLGLSVHDGGVGLSSESTAKLKENMVLTVEPGIYIPGFGGVRIEDDILVKKDGIEILTKFSRDFIEI